MKVYEIDGVQWHLADEGLLEIVKDFSGEDELVHAPNGFLDGCLFVGAVTEI